jgi:hypothetical protein
MPTILRLVEWYDRFTDTWRGQAPLAASLAELQHLFGVDPTDPMFDMYPVRPEHVAALQQGTEQRINLDSYEYFVTAVEGD